MRKTLSPYDLWHVVDNVGEVNSPALLVYPDRIEHNIRKMVEISGGVDLSRPADCPDKRFPSRVAFICNK